MQVKFTVEKLNLFYGSFQALHGIDMTIYGNKITALIGPSGCGKSTFLRTLNRMNDLIPGVTIKGSIKYDGKDIYGKNFDIIELRKKVGMVFKALTLSQRLYMKI
jgi:phosphate transport system ATP-binding protein